MQETRVPFLGQEDPLETERATHCSILAWQISWPEEPGRLQSWGCRESNTSGTTWYTRSSFNWEFVSFAQHLPIPPGTTVLYFDSVVSSTWRFHMKWFHTAFVFVCLTWLHTMPSRCTHVVQCCEHVGYGIEWGAIHPGQQFCSLERLCFPPLHHWATAILEHWPKIKIQLRWN